VFASDPRSAAIFVPIVAFWAWRGGRAARRNLLVALGVLALSDFVSGVVLKNAFPRVRPNGTNSSFPSSHAANSFGQAVYFSLLYPRAAALLLPIACLVALSRVVLGKHWPSDVVAGAAVGAMAGVCGWWTVRRLWGSADVAAGGERPSAQE